MNKNKLYTYGQEKPFELLREYDYIIAVGKIESNAKLVIFKGKRKLILSYEI